MLKQWYPSFSFLENAWGIFYSLLCKSLECIDAVLDLILCEHFYLIQLNT